jgi:hypothetical protein
MRRRLGVTEGSVAFLGAGTIPSHVMLAAGTPVHWLQGVAIDRDRAYWRPGDFAHARGVRRSPLENRLEVETHDNDELEAGLSESEPT